MIKRLLTSDKIYVSQSKIPNGGRGVFARVDIKKGETIEICPIVVVSKEDMSSLKESVLVPYFFYFGKKKENLAVVLGFGSIYNHSVKPNASYKLKMKNKVLEFTALRNIKKDEEITFNYRNSNKDKNTPLWFEV